MKTAEEWRKGKLPWQHRDATDNTNQYLYTDNEIKQIQLDAMKEGMRRAAKVITPDGSNNRIKRQEEGVQAILTTAEQLTTKDL